MIIYENRTEKIHVFEKEVFSFPMHLHHNLEFMLCTQGEMEVVLGKKSARLSQGMMMIALPNQIHAYRKIGPARFIVAMVSPEMLPALESYFSKSCDSGIYKGSPAAELLMQSLLSEYHGDRSEALMIGYIYVILAKAFKTFSFREQKTFPADTFSRAMTYISLNFKNNITLSDAARHVGVNHSHLSRLFTKNLGCSFLQYLHQLRSAYAQNLLVNTNLRISDIAFECGYASIRSFNRVFKEHSGLTPGEYRRRKTV